jgi:hypothetical protein
MVTVYTEETPNPACRVVVVNTDAPIVRSLSERNFANSTSRILLDEHDVPGCLRDTVLRANLVPALSFLVETSVTTFLLNLPMAVLAARI